MYYFNGQLPVFSHAQGDLASFRLFTSRLIVNGTATQGQIVKGFGVSLTTVKRAVKSLRERGAAGFFVPPAKRQGSKLTPERLAEAQRRLDIGEGVSTISVALRVLKTTLHKAIDDGRLVQKKEPPGPVVPLPDTDAAPADETTARALSAADAPPPTTKSQRSAIDTQTQNS